MSFIRDPFRSLGRRLAMSSRPGEMETTSASETPLSLRERPESAECEHVEGHRWIDRLVMPTACLECGDDDQSIAVGLRAGDERAFQMLVDRETARVFRICYRVLGSTAQAEDATLEAFAAAHRSLATFEGNQPAAWLAAITARAAWRYWMDRPEAGPGSPPPDAWKALPTGDVEVHELAGLDPGQLAQVRTSLASMPTDEREIIILHFYADLSLSEIAWITRRPAARVATKLEAGIGQVRQVIAEGGT